MEWLQAFIGIFEPQVLFFLTLGVVAGALIGVLPGLTATMAIAVLTPMTFWLPPASGFAMLIGVYNSVIWAGGIPSILINTPGTPANIATTLDGYPLSQKGHAMMALNINTVFSVVGGLSSSLVLIFFAFPMAGFALRFGPAEMAVVAFFGLSMMIGVSGKSPLKGLLTGFIGLLLATIGLDSMYAFRRFTMGTPMLLDGISFVPVMIGLFGIGEVLYQIYTSDHGHMEKINEVTRSKKKFLSLKELKQAFPLNLLTLGISNFIGIIPGAGGDIASIISWGQCKRLSKRSHEYGKGSLEGLAISCSSNSAVIGGSMTTMLALGIPGDAVTAVLIGALMMYGMTPGPQMFIDNRDFVLTLAALLVFANVMILIFGLITSRIYPKILRVKKQTLWVAVIVCCFVGGFAINNSPVDLIAMSIAGLLGFVLRKMDFPLGPMVLGLLLGRMLEANLRRALTISAGSYSIFLASPIAVFLIVCTALSLIAPPIVQYIKDRRKKQTIGTSSTTEES